VDFKSGQRIVAERISGVLYARRHGAAVVDTKGHYRQRLPYWEAVGNIVTVALIGFIAAGFVQFAAKNDPSRLWLASSWSLFGAFLLIGRSAARRALERNGMWKVPALLIGDGPPRKPRAPRWRKSRKWASRFWNKSRLPHCTN